ncbi:MAG: sensor histidine kinase [Sulfuricaulis sp.]
MDVGLLLVDSTCALEFANSLACDLLDCVNEAELKSRWGTMRPLLWSDSDLTQTARPQSLKVKLPINNKTRCLRLDTFALQEEACTGFLVLIKDSQSVDALETELLLASQMRTQIHLYGSLIHDLRAPMNVMQITLELLADTNASVMGADASVSQHHYIAVLKEELGRLNRKLNALIDNVKPSISDSVQEFDLRTTIEEVGALLRAQAMRRHIGLEYLLPGREVNVIGHRNRLKQALINIAINSLDAMSTNGRLQIEMVVLDASIIINVKNDGRALANELIDEINQFNFTAKKSTMGMGLYVARLVMESHGGTLQVVNLPDGCTCYTLTLPRTVMSTH